MAFCPQCQEEYDDAITHCAECGVELVENLETTGAARPEHVFVLVEEDHVAERLADALLAEGIEVHMDEKKHEMKDRDVPALVIPVEYADFVAVFVTQSDRFHVVDMDEKGRQLIGFFDPQATETVRAHPLMRKKPREIVAAGESVIPELVTLLEDGQDEVRRWACRRLLDLAAPGVTALREAAFRAVLSGNRELVFAAFRVLNEAEQLGMVVERGVPSSVIEALASSDASVRALACLTIGRLGESEDVPPLVPLLADFEPLVVEEVVEALESLTGIAVTLHAGSSDEERQDAIQKFKEWTV